MKFKVDSIASANVGQQQFELVGWIKAIGRIHLSKWLMVDSLRLIHPTWKLIMSEYRRAYQQQGCYFFTVVTYNREKILLEPDNVIRLRHSFGLVMKKLPFKVDAVVVLPDHIHCIWRLPPDDSDFSTRWRLIKRYFSIGMDAPLTKRSEKKV